MPAEFLFKENDANYPSIKLVSPDLTEYELGVQNGGGLTNNILGTWKNCIQFMPYNMGAITGTYNSISCQTSGLGSLNGMYFKSFDDGQGAGQPECTNVQLTLPTDYVDGTDIEITFTWCTGGTSGVVRWQAGLNNVSDTDTYSPSTYTWGTPQNITVPTTVWERDTATFTISGTGIVGGDDIGVVVFRDADNGADTYSGDAYIAVLTIKYTANALGE